MATNRPDTLDPALMRPGRLDRKVEFGLPELDGRTHIFKIHAKTMNCDRDIRYINTQTTAWCVCVSCIGSFRGCLCVFVHLWSRVCHRFELLARLCPSTTGAEIRSVCTEAGMFAIRARRKSISEKDFLDAINKVIRSYKKFSSTPKYMVYN